jgi:septal ring factor EnvC (AmiA/AmiB activator)
LERLLSQSTAAVGQPNAPLALLTDTVIDIDRTRQQLDRGQNELESLRERLEFGGEQLTRLEECINEGRKELEQLRSVTIKARKELSKLRRHQNMRLQ